MSYLSPLFSFLFLLSLIYSIANAQVPPSETFKFVNEGEFGQYINEYEADYRMIGIFNAPFELGFYNATPNAFTLALRLGLQRQEPFYRWVWEANRGKPVRQNATFSLGTDGNLVLAESDGTVVWQSNTANKGVVGFTFKFVNEGEFGQYINEYEADYRMIGIFNAPFELGFYNATPNAFTLALRLGLQRQEPFYRWVWEANRGKPVRQNATFSLGTDGNLVLAESDGTVVWQSNTANKGVVGFKLLSNGNMVLYDSKGNFIWQSFDYPTDTLLVGQSLLIGGVTKLVSRASVKENIDGPYSFVLEPKRLAMYYKSSNSPKPVLYFTFPDWFQGPLEKVTFDGTPEINWETDEPVAYQLSLAFPSRGDVNLVRPKYNATTSFLRLGIDGNLKIYTYYDKVDWGPSELTFTLFDRDSSYETECQLPERCGKLGVCEDNQCVACPTEKGLLGWSKECEPKKVTSCRPNDFHYYKVEGVDHYMTKFTRGTSIKVEDCGKKCTSDCKCLGYFYHQETSRCWIAHDLMTLTKFSNSTHVGFIKAPNN